MSRPSPGAAAARPHLRRVVRPDLRHLDRGEDTRVRLGALCEVFLALTSIGTAGVLWPIARPQSETLALSYVASRVVESTIIVTGFRPSRILDDGRYGAVAESPLTARGVS